MNGEDGRHEVTSRPAGRRAPAATGASCCASIEKQQHRDGNMPVNCGGRAATCSPHPTGQPLNPNSDYHRWKALLKSAGVRDARLHDARHTAATVLLVLGVPERTVMGIMGWSSTSMAARYQHVTDPVRHAVAAQVGGLLWAHPEAGRDAN